METCSECGGPLKGGSITGRKDGTKNIITMCWGCFNKDYELKRPAKTNIFVKKKKEADS